MRIAGLVVVALLGVGCGDTVRRTPLPNGYVVETMGRRYGMVIRPDGGLTSRTWTPIWPELQPGASRQYCGPFGWTDKWVVCRVVTYEGSARRMTDEYMVLDTESGAVSMVASVSALGEFFRLKGLAIPPLSDEHPQEFVLSW